MSGVSLRAFAESDVAAATELTNHFIEHTAVHFGDGRLTAAQFAQPWREEGERYPWLVAVVDGGFAGFAKAGSFRTRAAYRFTAEVAIYLGAAHRRRGIGRLLYAELLAELRRRGFHSAVGGIALPNDGSVRLHEALGFRHVGTFREVGYKFDCWHDVGFWQKELV